MARTTPISIPAACSIAVVRTEAAIEIRSFCGVSDGTNLLDDLGNRDRLKSDQDEVRCLCGSHIVGGNIDPPLSGELPGALFVLHCGQNLLRLQHLGLEEGLEQNPAHFSGSENGYPEAGKRMTGCVCAHRISLTYFCVFCCVLRPRSRYRSAAPVNRAAERRNQAPDRGRRECQTVPQRLLRPGPQLQKLELPHLVAQSLRRPWRCSDPLRLEHRSRRTAEC